MAIGTYIIPLNVSRLNAPTKRHRLGAWIQKQDPYIYTLYIYIYTHIYVYIHTHTHIYAIYKKPTSGLKTHIDWKWED